MFCAANGLRYANERDHLSKSVKRSVEQAAVALAPRPALHPFAFGDRHGWIGLGHVDVVLRWRDSPPTFLELKCGSGSDALRACVWDALKLATALLGGNARSAYLIAGAPTAVWRARRPGAEFFDSGEWETLGWDIRGRFRSDWKFWESETTPHIPGRVPTGFTTVELGNATFRIASEPWELRTARIESVGRNWIDWPSQIARTESGT